jgi:demethoxyubiquinone hydroxylase (CLK1/Coq7/Cat5 family)
MGATFSDACCCFDNGSQRVNGQKIDTEDPNMFLKLLREQHNDVYEAAFNENYVVCIPQSVSLAHRIRREDIETHILRQAPNANDNEYVALNGKMVDMVGNDLETKKGFEEQRKIHILCAEDLLHPDDEDRKLMVLHLSRPLQGGVEAPTALEEMNSRILKRYIGMLRSFPENEVVFNQLDAFIVRVKYSAEHDELKLVKPSLHEVVKGEWERCVRALIDARSFESSVGATSHSARKRHAMQIQQAVESYILEGIYDSIFPYLLELNRLDDNKLAKALIQMRSHTQQDLKIEPAFQCPIHEAVVQFAKLAKCNTPLEKLLCLKATAHALTVAIENNIELHYHDKGTYQLTTDDLLDELIYLLVQVRVVLRVTHMQHIHHTNDCNTTQHSGTERPVHRVRADGDVLHTELPLHQHQRHGDWLQPREFPSCCWLVPFPRHEAGEPASDIR